MTFNWEIEGPCSLEARVIVKVEMRTQLAGVKATPAHKGPDSPWGLQRATLMFLLTIDFNLVFLLFYLRNCDWLSTPPSCIPQHHSCLVGWFCFTEIVTLLKCTVQWFLIHSQSCAAIVTVCFHHLQKETPRLTCARHYLALLPACEPRAVTCLWLCLFCTYDINAFMQHVNFCVWLLSLSVVFSGKD